MQKKSTVLFLLSFILIGCTKKEMKETFVQVEEQQSQVVNENSVQDSQPESKTVPTLEQKIEQAMNNFQQGIEFFEEYSFEAIEDYDLKLLDFQINDDNGIDCFYDGKQFCVINDLKGKLENIFNLCIPYSDEWLYSSAFDVSVNGLHYFGGINLHEGVIKLYKSLQSDHQNSPPFYSGDSKYFVMDNTRIIVPSHYDYKLFKTVDAIYGGYIELYNYENNELVYRIDKSQLHETAILDIDQVQYDGDGFRIRIGNHYDSDEFVDFKLFTDNEDFRYEIYDSYTYERDE